MTLLEYQTKAGRIGGYPAKTRQEAIDYTLTKLAEEAGEVNGVKAKLLNGHYGRYYPTHGHSFKGDLLEELGDLLWCLSETATNAGISLDEIARSNLEKLERRKKAGLLTDKEARNE